MCVTREMSFLHINIYLVNHRNVELKVYGKRTETVRKIFPVSQT